MEGEEFNVTLGYVEFEANLGYERPCLKILRNKLYVLDPFRSCRLQSKKGGVGRRAIILQTF